MDLKNICFIEIHTMYKILKGNYNTSELFKKQKSKTANYELF